MANIIHLLPDSVANQIAAGEVIQRPASVIKELVENSIDAGANDIKVVVKDAGRTMIQVIDNGCGMSETDARLAFERHATSKISQVTDLYNLHTMGFRGEALASIAAVAQVELLTRRAEDELGIKIEIAGSKVTGQNPIATTPGSQFCIKNLFFNIPARRSFMKSDTTEMRHITSEFLRVALAHPDVALSLTSNGTPVYNLPSGNMKQRVSAIAGRSLAQNLIPIEVETSLVTIKGFIGTPETSRKANTDQYFFANDRYMRSPYFHKAVTDAYKNIIAPDLTPAYFIYINVDPQAIDVNVHPQKTEIKFEEETAIWQTLNASVRDSLGKFNIMPSLDFETANPINIPTYIPNSGISSIPQAISGNGASVYNPFEHEDSSAWSERSSNGGGQTTYTSKFAGGQSQNAAGWETLYNEPQGADNRMTVASRFGQTPNIEETLLFVPGEADMASHAGSFFQYAGKYIVVPSRNGLMFIDQHRAHERVQYDQISKLMTSASNHSQKLIFPELMPINAEDACIVEEVSTELHKAGLEMAYDAEKGLLSISAIPTQIEAADVRSFIEALIYDVTNGEVDIQGNILEHVTRTLASKSAMPYGRQLSSDEMISLYERLFKCQSPTLTPGGKRIITIIDNNDIDSRF